MNRVSPGGQECSPGKTGAQNKFASQFKCLVITDQASSRKSPAASQTRLSASSYRKTIVFRILNGLCPGCGNSSLSRHLNDREWYQLPFTCAEVGVPGHHCSRVTIPASPTEFD